MNSSTVISLSYASSASHCFKISSLHWLKCEHPRQHPEHPLYPINQNLNLSHIYTFLYNLKVLNTSYDPIVSKEMSHNNAKCIDRVHTTKYSGFIVGIRIKIGITVILQWFLYLFYLFAADISSEICLMHLLILIVPIYPNGIFLSRTRLINL